MMAGLWTTLGVTPQTVALMSFCFAGAFARALVTYGARALLTRKVVGDAIGSGASSVVLPWLVPAIALNQVPTIAIGWALFALTYATNDFAINLITRRWGQSAPPPPGGQP